MLQHARHGKLQEVVVSQVEAGEINSGEDAEREAPQQVGVQEQQLEGRHGVEGPGFDLADLVVLKIKVPEEERGRCDSVSAEGQTGARHLMNHINYNTSHKANKGICLSVLTLYGFLTRGPFFSHLNQFILKYYSAIIHLFVIK